MKLLQKSRSLLLAWMCLVGCLAVARCGSQTPSLHAFPLSSTWLQQYGYFWISNQQICFLEKTADPEKVCPVVMNANTGALRQLRAIETRYFYLLRISPTGKYFLFHEGSKRIGNIPPKWIVLDIGTGKQIAWPQSYDGIETTYTAWLPDGQHWAELVILKHELRI